MKVTRHTLTGTSTLTGTGTSYPNGHRHVTRIISMLATCYLLLATFPCLAAEEMSSYAQSVQEKITQWAIYPNEAKEKNLQGEVLLDLCISADGHLREVILNQSSGYKILDEAAAELVRKASPYPSFPQNIKLSQLWVETPIVYRQTSSPANTGMVTQKLQGEESPARTGEVLFSSPTENPMGDERPSIRLHGGGELVTLEECFDIALTNHQPASIAQEQVKLATLRIRQARRALYPSLTGEWRNTEGKTITDPYRSVSYGLQLEKTLYDGGKIRYALKQEELNLEMAKKNYQRVSDDLKFEVAKAYYELLRAKLILRQYEELSKEADRDAEIARKEYEAGLITQGEFLNVQSQKRQVSYQISSFQNEVTLATLLLHQVLNLDSEESIEISPHFELQPKKLVISLAECKALAQQSRAEVQYLELALKSSRYGEQIVKKERLPKLSLITSYGRSGEAYEPEDLTLTKEWSVMAKVGWTFGSSSLEYSHSQEKATPEEIVELARKTEASTDSLKFSLLDNVGLFSQIMEASIIHRQSLHELKETEKKISSEVEASYLNYQKALVEIDMALNQIKFRQEATVTMKVRWGLGEVFLSDFLETKIALAREKSSHIQALANYHLAIVSLERATGYAMRR